MQVCAGFVSVYLWVAMLRIMHIHRCTSQVHNDLNHEISSICPSAVVRKFLRTLATILLDASESEQKTISRSHKLLISVNEKLQYNLWMTPKYSNIWMSSASEAQKPILTVQMCTVPTGLLSLQPCSSSSKPNDARIALLRQTNDLQTVYGSHCIKGQLITVGLLTRDRYLFMIWILQPS